MILNNNCPTFLKENRISVLHIVIEIININITLFCLFYLELRYTYTVYRRALQMLEIILFLKLYGLRKSRFQTEIYRCFRERHNQEIT